jgi:hypothetical protein
MDGGKFREFLFKKKIDCLQRNPLFLAVYEWDTTTGKRSGEYVLKNCSYTGIAVSPDSRNFFAVGSDRKIKEISDSQVMFLLFYVF